MTVKRGIIIGLASYVLWGIMPLFWKLLQHVDSLEILAHRMLWSAVFLIPICLIACRADFLSLFRNRRAVLLLLGTGLIIMFNWGIYIFAVNTSHILQASMGYYINPLVSIIAGMLFFRERLSFVQKIALVLATVGVLFFTIDYGSFPWISIVLAVSFAAYGALKKFGGYQALPAMAMESSLVVPLAIAYIVFTFFQPGHAFLAFDVSGAFTSTSLVTTLLLICGGILTFFPLLLFSSAVNVIPLSWMGFMQYIAPTISLLLGIFIFHEPFTFAHTVCFCLIWFGLVLIVIESVLKRGQDKGRLEL
ncbi:MAG: EamA family transporter RarD [Coriobacteriia bacterium]|nr:EamA family transporter RarD [Coriobacteriia bacterium]